MQPAGSSVETTSITRSALPAATIGSMIRRMYVPAALLFVVLAMVGFWPSYFGPLFKGSVKAPLLIHLHAFVFTSWLCLFVAQVVFAATRHLRLHVQLGRWVMAYSVIVLIAGVLAMVEGFGARLATGDVFRAQRWLFGVIRDMAFFFPFLLAGWIYRRKPEIHKRLMIVATTIMVLPAVSRMSFLGAPVPLWTFMLVWSFPIYALMINDVRTKRLVHPVYLVGLVSMLTMRLILPLGSSAVWQAIASRITAFYRATLG
jgi:hypothetical protein